MIRQYRNPLRSIGVIVLAVVVFGSVRALSEDPTNGPMARPSAERSLASEVIPHEKRHDPWMPRPTVAPASAMAHVGPWTRDGYESIQVNVDEFGHNILGDAANEPSIAIDPTDPDRIVIGWRQFDTIESDFRQAGYGYSHDSGATWTFPGVLEPGVFRSDPVLEADADGAIYYYSLKVDNFFSCQLFKSLDGGVSWSAGVEAFGGDKPWMTIDRTNGVGRGNIYTTWSFLGEVTRSSDGGATFIDPVRSTVGRFGTLSVGPDGSLYIVDEHFQVAKSINARFPDTIPTFAPLVPISPNLQRTSVLTTKIPPNRGGLLGQVWVANDHSSGASRGNVYVLGSTFLEFPDPLDVAFARSRDGGSTWSDVIRVNDDPKGNGAWQWFGTMSVAPNGRIDVIFNDTRNSGVVNLSELFHTFSVDEGDTWSPNIPVSPVFDSFVGWPTPRKLGDYYDMISDDGGVNVAYAATFNGEQDVYFLRIPMDCNDNGLVDIDEVLSGSSMDCNGNRVPDECEADFDGDGLINVCDPDTDNDGVLNADDVCDFTAPATPIDAAGRPLSDTNANCFVDLLDYFRFQECLVSGGPSSGDSSVCSTTFDFDANNRINFADFAGFANAFTGLP